MSDWHVWVTDGSGNREAPLDVFESAEVIARMNDVGTWQLTVPTNTDAGTYLLSDPLARVEFHHGGSIWRSGPLVHARRDVDMDGDMVTATGADDVIWLQRRNAHPQPDTQSPPYDRDDYDTFTGDVATVLTELVEANTRGSGVWTPAVTPAGPNITVLARWQNLLTLCQDTVRPSGLVFSVVDLGFVVRSSVNSGAVFAEGLETLAAWSMTIEAPTVNKAVVAGAGIGKSRLVREVVDQDSIDTWGLVETFVDRRDTADTTELDKAGLEAVTAGVKPVVVTFTPVDTEGQAFGRDWDVGDTVTVRAGDLSVVDQVREVHVTIDAKGVSIVPTVGSVTGGLPLFRTVAGLDRRLRQLERI